MIWAVSKVQKQSKEFRNGRATCFHFHENYTVLLNPLESHLVASKKKAKQCLKQETYFSFWREKAEVPVCWLWVYY